MLLHYKRLYTKKLYVKLHYGVGKYKKSYDRPFISFQMMQQAVLLWFSEEEEEENRVQ